jgi:sugar-phosphatase
MKAAIFDMDGLLIDSEPLWQEAEVNVFKSVGVPLTREMCRETMGVRLDAVVRHWYEKFPWRGESLEVVEARVLEEVSRLIVSRGKPMPGVRETIAMLSAAEYELAVASSSPLRLIHTALDTFELRERDPCHCIAFEDSALGVHAAKSAGAWVIAVPDQADISNPAFADADVVLSSLTEFSIGDVR